MFFYNFILLLLISIVWNFHVISLFLGLYSIYVQCFSLTSSLYFRLCKFFSFICCLMLFFYDFSIFILTYLLFSPVVVMRFTLCLLFFNVSFDSSTSHCSSIISYNYCWLLLLGIFISSLFRWGYTQVMSSVSLHMICFVLSYMCPISSFICWLLLFSLW